MPTYERADKSVERLADELLKKYETHAPLVNAGVKIDLIFARGSRDEEGNQTGDAITHQGRRALGLAKINNLKDRVMGRGDAEIQLDGDYWPTITDDQQAALLDHELHHLSLKSDKHGNVKFDDHGRPMLKMRKHDVEFGWFSVIAQRHGKASIEQRQAAALMEMNGQFYWPDLVPGSDSITMTSGGKSITMPLDSFAKAAAKNI